MRVRKNILLLLIITTGCHNREGKSGLKEASPTSEITNNYVIPDSLNFPNVRAFDNTNDWKKLKLKGTVKSLSETEYILRADNNELLPMNKKPKLLTRFNDSGFITEKWMINNFDSTKIKKQFYRYDQIGKLLDVREYDGKKNPYPRYAFVYDSTGTQIEDYTFSDDGSSGKYVSKFDTHGNRIQLTGYNMKTGGDQFVQYTYRYDKRNNPLEELCSFVDHGSSDTYQYWYDENGNIIKQKKVSNYKATTSGMRASKHTTITRYVYDQGNNLIEEKDKNSTTTFILDSFGNWIESRTIFSDKRGHVVKRMIEYF